MVVKLFRDPGGSLVGFLAEGHVGSAEKGRDIVCAAVSALTQTAVLGLEQHAGCSPRIEVDDAAGRLLCRLEASPPGEGGTKAQAILETLLIGLRAMQDEYGEYVRVKEVAP